METYVGKAKKNKKLGKVGKFARLNKLSTMKKAAVSDIKEAMEEVADQKKALEEQVVSQAKIAGATAIFQLVQSSVNCYTAVAAYHEHASQLDKWQSSINSWWEDLNMNRQYMITVLDKYKKEKEWDIDRLSMITWRANEILGEVQSFTTDMVARQKAAKGKLLDGGFGFVSHVLSAATNIVQAVVNPVSGWSAVAGGAYAAASGADLGTVAFAYFDLQQLGESLSRGTVLLQEVTKQAAVLKKGRKIIEKAIFQASMEKEVEQEKDVEHDEL